MKFGRFFILFLTFFYVASVCVCGILSPYDARRRVENVGGSGVLFSKRSEDGKVGGFGGLSNENDSLRKVFNVKKSPLWGVRGDLAFAPTSFPDSSAGDELKALGSSSPPEVKKYCESLYECKRFPSNTVNIGRVKIGSKHPIATQTMTTSDTRDVEASVLQVIRSTEAGADIVRLTVQGMKEAQSAAKIREELFKRNCYTPLVADIHFNPKVAMLVADAFEKIRVNPGNFVDGRKKFEEHDYSSEDEFLAGREKITSLFAPLVEKCKSLNRAIRIGTNHGSLSSRILSYYGDTPRGMVESAFEFAEICRQNDFHNFCFSMKASNPSVMVQAYRLLVSEMYKRKWFYPIHLGVTEAGEGEDGRIKSAIGIGSLLQDGIGDTIRVSLTEDPWLELKPCRRFAQLAATKAVEGDKQRAVPKYVETTRDFESYDKRVVELPMQKFGDDWDVRGVLHRDGSVISRVKLENLQKTAEHEIYSSLGCKNIVGMPFKDLTASDSLYLDASPPLEDAHTRLVLERLQAANMGVLAPYHELLEKPLKNAIAVMNVDELKELMMKKKQEEAEFAGFSTSSSSSSGNSKKETQFELPEGVIRVAVALEGDESIEQLDVLKAAYEDYLLRPVLVIFKIKSSLSNLHASRRMFDYLKSHQLPYPVIHHFDFNQRENLEDISLKVGMEAGALLVDKLGDGVIVEGSHPINDLRLMSFNLLQGCRMRNTKTEFISCPSCGRTLFDLQEVTDQIRRRTGHLPGVAIAVMGCIVNGVGEMADADFGYVGGAPGKVDLYVGKELVKRGIPNEIACDRLIELIKEHGRWVEPTPSPTAA